MNFNTQKSGFNNGFTMTFDNGFTVSVQFGRANYCDYANQSSAEVAAWKVVDGEQIFVNLGEHDDVVGYCSPETVAELIYRISKFNK